MRYLLDTDVLVDALRGYAAAVSLIRGYHEFLNISVLTVTELYAGVRGSKEEHTLRDLLALFPKIGISEQVAQKGGVYRNRYGKSHGTGLIDALLAATVEAEDLRLVTLNKKHYPMIKELWIPYKK